MKTRKGKPFAVKRLGGLYRQKYWYVVDAGDKKISGGWMTKEAAEHELEILLKSRQGAAHG